MLVKQPAHDMRNFLIWDLRVCLWSNKLLSRTVPCKLISNFISTCTRILGYTDSVTEWWVEVLLLYQWGCFGSLKSFQGCLTIRSNTDVYLWSDNLLNFIDTGQESLWPGSQVYLPREILNLLSLDCPNTLTPVPLGIPDSSVYQLSPLTEGGGLCALIHHCLAVIIILYLGSEFNAGLIIWGYFKEFLHFLVCRVIVIGRLLRLGSTVHCILVVWLWL
jgi:hypothetical protein